MSDGETPNHLQTFKSFAKVLGVAVILFAVAYAPDFFIESPHSNSAPSGWLDVILLLVFALVCCYIWVGLVFGVCHFLKSKRFRTACALVPIAIFGVYGVIESLTPPNPHRVFNGFTGTELPVDAQNIQWYHDRSGFDWMFHFYFETSPEEVDRIVHDMNLERDNWFGIPGTTPMGQMPDYRKWQGTIHYAKGSGSFWNKLITNGSKTKVYIQMGDT